MADLVVIKPAVARQFDALLARGRAVFLSAPCGFGKTTLAQALLPGRRVLRLSAEAPDFSLPSAAEDWNILLLDDLQHMQDERDWQELCTLIRTLPDRRFVLLSRGSLPGCLMAFQYTGLLEVLGPTDLLFDREDIRRLFQLRGVSITEAEISGILKESDGYPLGAAITARCMAGGMPFGPALIAQSFREVFFYFEAAIYQRFDLPVRRFLLELAPFESFDLEMARMVSGDPRAGELLDWLQRNTTMFRCDGIQRFRFWPQFQAFLQWELEREYSEEKRRALLSRGGLYYELREDYSRALDCYTRGGDHSKVSELLIRNAELHPGMGHYSEMDRYYRSLPDEEILASPSLMQAMSMLCALEGDYSSSERWYTALERFAGQRGRQDAAGKQARSRLAWLDISLPQRDVESLTDTIPAVFRLVTNREIALPSFSVTSALPSIMNGGKDFSAWSRRDDLLYSTLRLPVEAVLGRDGVGLADCAVAESKFEKGEDISRRMLTLISRMGEIQNNGTPDMEFAVSGLLARSQLDSGQSDDARRTLEALRRHFADAGQTRFFPNIDAMLCRIALHTGSLDAVDTWYRDKAPRDPIHLCVMKRYQYLTQAMAELAAGRPEAALVTLAPLRSYCQTCRRHIDGIHLDLLSAIALFRQQEESWREQFAAGLRAAEEFRFVRTISVYGSAVLPLLEAQEWPGDRKWLRSVLNAVRTQAAYYPLFLEPPLSPGEALTATEVQILRLMCADKSNAEIGRIMNIKLSTVKTHVSHILEKLGVSRRSEARTAAEKLWLIPDRN